MDISLDDSEVFNEDSTTIVHSMSTVSTSPFTAWSRANVDKKAQEKKETLGVFPRAPSSDGYAKSARRKEKQG